MKRQLLSAFFLLCSTFALTADPFPPEGFKEMSSEVSANEGFKIIHFKKDPDNYASESQIWVQALKPEFKTQLLFSHNNRSSWNLADDEQGIAINFHQGSTDNLLLVFLRGKDGLFKKVEKDFREEAHKLVQARYKLDKGALDFDHDNCHAITWLRDGFLLAELDGNLSGEYYLKPWYFIYDTQHDKFLTDLDKINQPVKDVEHPRK